MSPRGERGGLAIVLHTHMPYVEGFGTWPFGEEWLWEAVACSYLPLLELLDRGAPLTLSLTPVLCDQLEADSIGERFEHFVEEVRRVTHERDAAALRAEGRGQLARELERSWGDYALALERLGARGGDLLGSLRPHAQWTSSATHAILPLMAGDAGVRLQVNSGVASHRRRFGDGWRGGFWLPECAYAPWLLRDLEDAGVRATCVELTSSYGLGAREHLRPLASDSGVSLVPIDRATMSLVWSAQGYPAAGPYRDNHRRTRYERQPWSNAGDAYDHGAAVALAREHARDFVARVRSRLRGVAGTRSEPLPGGGLVVCALDTELLGHWWYEGVAWLEGVIEECSLQQLELIRLDDALERHGPGAAATDDGADAPAHTHAQWPASSWGSRGDLSTWSGPPVADMAFAARAAELRVVARGGLPSATAVRELLALQASDWPFMVSREVAAPYGRERFAGHLEALERALAGEPERDGPGVRNLAVERRPGDPGLSPVARRLHPAHPARGRTHPDDPRRCPGEDGVGGKALGHDAARTDDAVVPDGDTPEQARPIADPHVVADVDIALVDPLQADRALDLGHPVVEVDHHDTVGDDALAADGHVLEGRDRALLADHALGADVHFALVHPDLAAVADPRPATHAQCRPAADLELHARADEADPIGLKALAVAELEHGQTREQARVVEAEHVVRTHEPQQLQGATPARAGRVAGRGCARTGSVRRAAGSAISSMAVES